MSRKKSRTSFAALMSDSPNGSSPKSPKSPKMPTTLHTEVEYTFTEEDAIRTVPKDEKWTEVVGKKRPTRVLNISNKDDIKDEIIPAKKSRTHKKKLKEEHKARVKAMLKQINGDGVMVNLILWRKSIYSLFKHHWLIFLEVDTTNILIQNHRFLLKIM